MKKTMFITSVIMVVVLAIALTTSSLAWFSAGGNTSVNINAFSVSAISAQSVSGLEISLTRNNTDFATTPVTIPALTQNVLRPTCPVGPISSVASVTAEELYNALQIDTTQSGVGLYESRTATINGNFIFNEAATAIADANRCKKTIYIRNSGAQATYAQCEITLATNGWHGTNSTSRDPQIWVAVFAIIEDQSGESPVVTGKQLLNLVAFRGSETAQGMTFPASIEAIGQDADPTAVRVQELGTFTLSNVSMPVGSVAQDNQGHDYFKAGQEVPIEIYIWYDGNLINDMNRDATADVVVTFNKAASATRS